MGYDKRVKPETPSPLSQINPKDFRSVLRGDDGRLFEFSAGDYKLYIKLASEGLTDAEICTQTGWRKDNFDDWKKSDAFLKYLHLVNETKEWSDKMVENALFTRCIGGTRVKKVTIVEGTDNVKGAYYEKRTEEAQLPPDVKACQLFLQARMRSRYGNQVKFSDMTDQELISNVKDVLAALESKNDYVDGSGEPQANTSIEQKCIAQDSEGVGDRAGDINEGAVGEDNYGGQLEHKPDSES